MSNLASDLLATKTFVNSWELSRPFLKFRRKEMWVSRGQEKELKQGGEESIYGSLMAKLWHFQTPSCAAYPMVLWVVEFSLVFLEEIEDNKKTFLKLTDL